MTLGVNEVLCKPVSAKALYNCLISILLKLSKIVSVGDHYGSEPRQRKNKAKPVTADQVNPHVNDCPVERARASR